MMRVEKSIHPHVVALSKHRPKAAYVPECDNHDTEKERKKCHKQKIGPPTT